MTLTHLMTLNVLVYRARRAEARITQMLWKVNYSDIVFINTVCTSMILRHGIQTKSQGTKGRRIKRNSQQGPPDKKTTNQIFVCAVYPFSKLTRVLRNFRRLRELYLLEFGKTCST